MSDLTEVITQAGVAGLTTVYYTATPMAANGRYTLLTYDGRKPQVICNPAGIAALVEAMNEAGIRCEELRMEDMRIVLKNTGASSGLVDVYAVPEDEG